MMTMKSESKTNRGTYIHFTTICPTISVVKNLLIYEDVFFGNLQNCCKIYNKRELCWKKYSKMRVILE